MRKLIKNSIRSPDGTLLTSQHQHDFRSHRDTITGELYFTDGGTSYIRKSVNVIPYEDLSVYSDDPFEIVRNNVEWGNYGKNGNEPLQYKTISELSSNHIKSILSNCKVVDYMKELFEKELSFRSECEQKGGIEKHWEED